MVNKIIFLLLMFIFDISTAFTQININLDDDCLKKNSAILSKALIDLKGKDFVTSLLDNQTVFSMFCNVDSLGFVIGIKKKYADKRIDKFKNEIESYLILNNVFFYICYEKLPDLTDCESHKLITQDLMKIKKTNYFISVGFPGSLMDLYLYECKKREKEGIILSRYEYLISQIDEYYSDKLFLCNPCEE